MVVIKRRMRREGKGWRESQGMRCDEVNVMLLDECNDSRKKG